jgi:hypothetical protein
MNKMVIWVPQKQHELRRVYDFCKAMGAPHFLSPDDMRRWLDANAENVEAFFSGKYHQILATKNDSLLTVLVRHLGGIYSHGNILADELKWLVFKALHTPLRINRRSLHPLSLAA